LAPFWQLLPGMAQLYLHGLLHPMFWLFVALIYFQYRRLEMLKEGIFGVPSRSAWGPTVQALLFGVVGGLFGSVLMLLFGVTLSGSGIIFLLPLALVLMLINPRFLCFAYAGGLLAASSLLLGFPQLQIPQLMGLVAILHMIESSLIFLSGHLGAVPIYTRNRRGQVVGAFNLQKFWPIPVIALLVQPLPLHGAATGLSMLEWWPLLRPYGLEDPVNLLFIPMAVAAALGYSELAITCRPRERTRKSAIQLAAYSVVLLLLSWMASKWPGAIWFPVLFAPLGHELIILAGQKMELEGDPLFIQPERGVMVLDVLPGSPASNLGLATGDIVFSVNGIHVNNRYDLNYLLELSDEGLELEFRRYSDGRYAHKSLRKVSARPLGLILAPGENEPVVAEILTSSPLKRWWQKFRG